MARTSTVVDSFTMRYVTEFETVVRGHHVYKTIWSAVTGEVLYTRPDDRVEATNYDPYAIGVYKEEACLTLVGHVPVEISHILHHFLGAQLLNRVMVTITGKRKREAGLVVPAKYQIYTSERKTDKIQSTALLSIQNSYTTLELKYTGKKIHFTVPIF